MRKILLSNWACSPWNDGAHRVPCSRSALPKLSIWEKERRRRRRNASVNSSSGSFLSCHLLFLSTPFRITSHLSFSRSHLPLAFVLSLSLSRSSCHSSTHSLIFRSYLRSHCSSQSFHRLLIVFFLRRRSCEECVDVVPNSAVHSRLKETLEKKEIEKKKREEQKKSEWEEENRTNETVLWKQEKGKKSRTGSKFLPFFSSLCLSSESFLGIFFPTSIVPCRIMVRGFTFESALGEVNFITIWFSSCSCRSTLLMALFSGEVSVWKKEIKKKFKKMKEKKKRNLSENKM